MDAEQQEGFRRLQQELQMQRQHRSDESKTTDEIREQDDEPAMQATSTPHHASHNKLSGGQGTDIGSEFDSESTSSSTGPDCPAPQIRTLNDIFFPRIEVSRLCQPLQRFNTRSFARSLSAAALPSKIRKSIVGAFRGNTVPVLPQHNDGRSVGDNMNTTEHNVVGHHHDVGLPNVQAVTSWLHNLSSVVDTFNDYLKAFAKSERQPPRHGERGERGEHGERSGSPATTQSFLHLAHVINILKGILISPPRLLLVQDFSRTSDRYDLNWSDCLLCSASTIQHPHLVIQIQGLDEQVAVVFMQAKSKGHPISQATYALCVCPGELSAALRAGVTFDGAIAMSW